MEPKNQGLLLAGILSIAAVGTGVVILNKDSGNIVPVQPPTTNNITRRAFLYDAGHIKNPSQMFEYASIRPWATNRIPIYSQTTRSNIWYDVDKQQFAQHLNFLTFSVPLGCRRLLVELLDNEPYLAWIPVRDFDYADDYPRDITVDIHTNGTNSRPTFRILYGN